MNILLGLLFLVGSGVCFLKGVVTPGRRHWPWFVTFELFFMCGLVLIFAVEST